MPSDMWHVFYNWGKERGDWSGLGLMNMWETTEEGLDPAGCCVVTKPLYLEGQGLNVEWFSQETW